MNEIKKARRLIEADPQTDAAKTLASLVRALESEEKFDLGDLYKLSYDHFHMAIDVMKEWRLDRYYSGKAKLHDLSVQVANLSSQTAS
jgi:hypothetical protein